MTNNMNGIKVNLNNNIYNNDTYMSRSVLKQKELNAVQ